MIQLETIRICLFKESDTDEVKDLIQKFKDKLNETHEQTIFITLFKNKNVENEWSIHLAFLMETAKEAYKFSTLLSEALRTIAMVSRDAWTPVLLKEIKNPQEIQDELMKG